MDEVDAQLAVLQEEIDRLRHADAAPGTAPGTTSDGGSPTGP
jgi:hypothetical protein